MKLKKGVSLRNIRPQINVALAIANDVYADRGYELVVTSVNDGKHSTTSLHYDGAAADLRTRHLGDQTIAIGIVENLREQLGPDFDVILESDHIHLEWQPKRASG